MSQLTPENKRKSAFLKKDCDSASVSNCSEPVHAILTHQTGPENVTGTPSTIPEKQPEKCLCEHKAKSTFQPCKGVEMDFKEDGPNSRGSDRKSRPNLTGLAGTNKCLRKAAGTSDGGLCGECQHIFSQQKTLEKKGPKSISPESEPLQFQIKKERNTVTQTSKNIFVLINKNPEVTLCDLAKKCDTCSHNCGFVLPDVLKTKVVHCFKQDLSDGFRFGPTCLEHKKRRCERGGQAKKSVFCLSVPHEKRICQSKSRTTHQKYAKRGTDLQMLSRKTTCCFHKSNTSEESAACSICYSLGKHTDKVKCQAAMRDRDAEEDPGPGSDVIGTVICKDKRQKLEDGVGCSMTFDSAVKERSITKNLSVQTDGPTKTHMSELLCQNNELDSDDPESFTCQRVQPYLGKTNISCARTYMPWPFLSRCRNLKAAGSLDSTARDNSDCAALNPNQPGSSNNQIKEMVQSAPTEKQDEEGILAKRNGNSSRNNMLSKSNIKELKNAVYSFSTTASGSGLGTDSPVASSLLDNVVSNSSMSTPSPSDLGLSDWETANTSGPFTNCGSSNVSAVPSSFSPSSCPLKNSQGAELKEAFLSEETQMSSCSSSFSASLYTSDSCESSLLPQDQYKSQSPPTLKPWYTTSPLKHNLACSKESFLLCTVPKKQCAETYPDECLLPPVLSPVTSPTCHLSRRSFSCQSSSDEEEEKNKTKSKLLPVCHMSQIDNIENSKDYVEHSDEELDRVSSSSKSSTEGTPRESSPSRDDDGKDEESQDESDCEDNVEHGNKSSAQDPLYPKIKSSLTSGVLTEPRSSPSSDEYDGGAFTNGGSNPNNITGIGSPEIKEPADDSQPVFLDEFSAYQQDILLVDVIQDDPELFNNLHKKSLLKLGPTRALETVKGKPAGVKKLLSSTDGAPGKVEQRLMPVTGDFHCDSPDITEESNSRPWRPQMSATTTEMQNKTCPYKDKQTQNVVFESDVNNNNNVDGGLLENCRRQPASSPHNIVPLMSLGNGSWITKSTNVIDLKRQSSDVYCRQYFSESLSCGYKKCRFQHLPVEGDEKFCVETVIRFTKTPMCLQKAGAVFIGYYQKNPPGIYFSMPALLSLLWALLKAGLVSDVFAVLSVSLAHNLLPNHEYLLALYNFVREKGLMALVPELIQLTFKMVSAGLELGLDCLDCVKNAPVSQQSAHLNSPVSVSATQKVSTIAPFPEYLDLALAIVEIELCSRQENWRRLGEVFKSICKFSQHPQQVERISGRVAIALLSESKDKLSLPFSAFAETVCQNEGEDSPVMGFVGRIGVSLMLRYHKTHQWLKGRRVVEMLSFSKVKYSTLKGLFGNEDGTSRCYLVTVATELFLWSGSGEGALQTLRDNEWFVSSCLWPCEPADLEGRIRVLIRLTEKTSHRDTLEVLSNLPGIKEPNALIDISRYTPLFNSHLQVCVDRQILPVAAETVDFMFSKNLAVDHAALQVLLHKLGKQNLWLRAREVFRQSISVGYYPGVLAPPGFMSLIVPCRLGEVELALTFEMFITVNAPAILHPSDSTTASLSITLKRTQTCESDYLSAGSRVLSAACILQPKLVVHYTAVNSSQEQVFTLDVSSARRWLRHNHLWANEVWAH